MPTSSDVENNQQWKLENRDDWKLEKNWKRSISQHWTDITGQFWRLHPCFRGCPAHWCVCQLLIMHHFTGNPRWRPLNKIASRRNKICTVELKVSMAIFRGCWTDWDYYQHPTSLDVGRHRKWKRWWTGGRTGSSYIFLTKWHVWKIKHYYLLEKV